MIGSLEAFLDRIHFLRITPGRLVAGGLILFALSLGAYGKSDEEDTSVQGSSTAPLTDEDSQKVIPIHGLDGKILGLEIPKINMRALTKELVDSDTVATVRFGSRTYIALQDSAIRNGELVLIEYIKRADGRVTYGDTLLADAVIGEYVDSLYPTQLGL